MSRLSRPSSATSTSLGSSSPTISTSAATALEVRAMASSVSVSPEAVALARVQTASLLNPRSPSAIRLASDVKTPAPSSALTCSALPAATLDSASSASLRTSARGQSISRVSAGRPALSITACVRASPHAQMELSARTDGVSISESRPLPAPPAAKATAGPKPSRAASRENSAGLNVPLRAARVQTQRAECNPQFGAREGAAAILVEPMEHSQHFGRDNRRARDGSCGCTSVRPAEHFHQTPWQLRRGG
eukprot:scaffold465_cov120-Isochrysis_galbana.AAC.3